MRWPRVLIGLLAAGVAGLAGCEREPDPGGPRAKRDYARALRPAPGPRPAPPPGPGGLKPPDRLEVPEGLTDPVQDFKLPKKGWEAYRKYKPGTFVEYGLPNGTLRRELVDLADHAAMDLSTVALQTGGMDIRQRIATRLLFTEEGGDWPPAPRGDEVQGKPDRRKVMVGQSELETDTVYEVKTGEKTTRVWVSDQVPLGGVVLIEDADGKPLQKLTAFGGPE